MSGSAFLQQTGYGGGVDQGRSAGSENDSSLSPSVPLEPSAAGAVYAGLKPGEFGAASGFAKREIELVLDQLAATVGEVCTLPLAIASGRTSEPAAVRGDARSDRALAATNGIDRDREGQGGGSPKQGPRKWHNYAGAGSECCTVGSDSGENCVTLTRTGI